MIRQFTIVPALLVIFAMIISACSAEIGGGGADGSGSGSSSSGSSVSSAQSDSGGSGSLAGKLERVLDFFELMCLPLLLEVAPSIISPTSLTMPLG